MITEAGLWRTDSVYQERFYSVSDHCHLQPPFQDFMNKASILERASQDRDPLDKVLDYGKSLLASKTTLSKEQELLLIFMGNWGLLHSRERLAFAFNITNPYNVGRLVRSLGEELEEETGVAGAILKAYGVGFGIGTRKFGLFPQGIRLLHYLWAEGEPVSIKKVGAFLCWGDESLYAVNNAISHVSRINTCLEEIEAPVRVVTSYKRHYKDGIRIVRIPAAYQLRTIACDIELHNQTSLVGVI